MVASGQGYRVNRHLQLARAFGMAWTDDHFGHRCLAQMRGPKAPGAGHKAFDLAQRPHPCNLFLVAGPFGKHAQLQHGALTRGEIHNHVGVVQNVGGALGVGFIPVVVVYPGRGVHTHRLALGQVAHQVKKVAALFNQRAAGVPVEAVPVAHFDQEGKAVLTDGEHLERPGMVLAMHFLRQQRNGWHVAVFHGHPNGCRVAGLQGGQAVHIVELGAGGFFQQQRQRAQAGDLAQLLGMAKVGAGDEQAIHVGGQHHLGQTGRALRAGGQRQTAGQHGCIGLKNARDLRTGQQGDVAQMLFAHHAAANDAVACGGRGGSGGVQSQLSKCRG